MIMARCLPSHISGLSEVFAENFCQFRIEAELRARRNQKKGEVTLTDIYEQLISDHSLDPAEAFRIADIEIELEADQLVVVPEIMRLMEYSRALGKRVIFISDMYLPAEPVRLFLNKKGLLLKGDALYISSEIGMTKGTGDLFELVLTQEKCQPSELLHIGDNLHSDVASARRHGINAQYYTATSLTKYEQTLLGSGEFFGQLLAGAARFARLRGINFKQSTDKTLFELGASVAGPLFTAYLAWIRSQARQLGVRRLYFVSRDGQVLHKIAEHLFREDDVEIRYLYGSRQAWHLPALNQIGEYELWWLTQADPHLTIRVLAGRILIDPAHVRRMLHDEGLSKELDAAFSEDEICRLKELLVSSTRIAESIKDSASELRKCSLGYFKQEGLLEPVPWALVDLGWHGNLQESLQLILNNAGYEMSVRGFYFGLTKDVSPGSLKHPFLFSPASRDEAFKIGSYFVQLAELLACADHGSAIRYEFTGNGYIPILKKQTSWIADWGIEYLRLGILSFVENLRSTDWLDSAEVRMRILDVMKILYFSPTKDEAVALGDYLFSSDQSEAVLKPFAPALTLGGALNFIRLFGDPRSFQITFWLHGSRVRSHIGINLFLQLCSFLLRSWDAVKKMVFRIS